jgi:hypothetical protein
MESFGTLDFNSNELVCLNHLKNHQQVLFLSGALWGVQINFLPDQKFLAGKYAL